jgi:hypothetical protein
MEGEKRENSEGFHVRHHLGHCLPPKYPTAYGCFPA